MVKKNLSTYEKKVSGKDFYNQEIYDDLSTKSIPKKLHPVEVTYKVGSMKDDLKRIPELESKAVRQSYKILVVDDNDDLREFVADFIKEAGFENVVKFDDPLAAYEYAINNDVNLILSDYRMPGLDGYQLWCRLKEVNCKAQFVMISGYGTNIEFQNLKKAGVTIMPKPFKGENLEMIVKMFYVRYLRGLAGV